MVNLLLNVCLNVALEVTHLSWVSGLPKQLPVTLSIIDG